MLRIIFYALVTLLLFSGIGYANQTILYYKSDPGDYIGRGQEKYYTADDLDFIVMSNYGSYNRGVYVRMHKYISWSAHFAAPYRALLAVGTYENATRFPFQANDEPGLSFYGQGRGCNRLTGRFEIKEIIYDPISGDVTNLAVDFEQHCEGREPALYGYIRYNSDVSIPTLISPKIEVENLLNNEGCVEAYNHEGSVINLSTSTQYPSPFIDYEWSTSLGHIGYGDTFSFDLGVDQSATVYLTVEDTSTGETATSSMPVCVSDTTPPSITILSPSPGEVFVGNNIFLEVVITDTVDQNIDTYDVIVGNTNSFPLDTDTNSSRIKLFKLDSESIAVPTDIIVEAVDAYGNIAHATVEIFRKHDKRK